MRKKYITKRKMEKDVQEFLKQYDDGDSGERSTAAYQLILETLIWGSRNHFEALGILEEVKMTYRESYMEWYNQNENQENN